MIQGGNSKKGSFFNFTNFFIDHPTRFRESRPVMKTISLRKLAIALVVFAGFAAMNPLQAARVGRPPANTQPPAPVSGL